MLGLVCLLVGAVVVAAVGLLKLLLVVLLVLGRLQVWQRQRR